ncbi:MAG TPA: 50S ribosomal protein L25 [Thermoanaerobaculia bacterium]|nr:50S ribosomal protein L25 [Thermoanaerobaculia bacterium]
MSDVTIEVSRREMTGTGANRRLRRTGQIPAVVYGTGGDPLAIQIDDRKVHRLIKESGENAVFLLRLQGTEQSRHTMIREIQWDPLTGRLVHIDFQRVKMDEVVRVHVPIELLGTPLGVKNEAGLVDFVTREIEVECLPGDIPDHLSVDISELHIGQHVEASDLPIPDKVTLVTEASRVIAAVSHAKLAAAAEEEEEVVEGEELIEKVAEEPEVLHKGKETE